MNSTAEKSAPLLWVAPPARKGLSWVRFHLTRQATACVHLALNRFISLVGSFTTPGLKPAGVLQAWALRRMGASCPSSQIWIGPHVWFDHPHNIVFGRRVTISAGGRITAFTQVVLGDNFLAAPGLFINTGTHDLATLTPSFAPVVIGDGVWCGMRVTVCAGATIGAGAVVGAGSVVVKSLPAAHVCVGVPCKPVRDIAHLRREDFKPWNNFL